MMFYKKIRFLMKINLLTFYKVKHNLPDRYKQKLQLVAVIFIFWTLTNKNIKPQKPHVYFAQYPTKNLIFQFYWRYISWIKTKVLQHKSIIHVDFIYSWNMLKKTIFLKNSKSNHFGWKSEKRYWRFENAMKT